ILFNNIRMITQGTDVVFAGKRIGEVREISFADSKNLAAGVIVKAEIDNNVRLPASITAAETSTSIVMGRAIVQLEPASVSPQQGFFPTDGKVFVQGTVQNPLEGILPPSTVPTLQKTIEQIGELVAALTPVAKELEELIKARPIGSGADENATMIGNLSTVTQRLDIALRHLNALLGDPGNQDNLKVTLANLRKGSEEVNKAIVEFRKVATNADGVVTEARSAVGEVRKGVANMDTNVAEVSK